MVRSMYSGVAGMRANQNRMDVIGNNISNSNTYGFKSSRATFRDIYYQTYKGASEGTITRGGINPSAIGYGAQLASIDLMMDSASMTSTGFALDCAITGDGFFQVMDPDGNIFYTKAGMLDIDQATGALLDSNGNFVLGTSATDGKLDSSQPGQNKIIIALDAVPASTAKVTAMIGGRTITIESTGQNKDANISFTFSKSNEMPDGQKVKIVREGTSSVYNVQLNANEYFEPGELEKLVNEAITENYGGQHPGGKYSFKIDPDPFEEAIAAGLKGLTGAELVDTPTVDYEGGSITAITGDDAVIPRGYFGFGDDAFGLTFSGEGKMTLRLDWFAGTDNGGTAFEAAPAPQEPYVKVTMVDENNTTYTGYILLSRLAQKDGGGSVLLTNTAGEVGDTITLDYPGRSNLLKGYDPANPDDLTNVGIGDLFQDADGKAVDYATAVPQHETRKCGWGKSTLTLEGGTEFHTQSVADITGISIGADGIITGTTENGLTVLGRIDLANFGNPKGLEQVGSSYFAESANSGKPKLCIAGEGGTGNIKNSALEMSNVDLAQEFSDMIVTQRGFQASSRMITVSDTMLEELTNLKR